jgi:hypothetical protein
MVKNLQKKSSNGCENGTNGSSTSKNPWLGFYGTSIGQKLRKLDLLHFPPSTLLELVLQNAPLCALTWNTLQNARLNPAPSGSE